MALEVDIADYIATETTLTVDTNLFIGDEPDDSPDACVTVVGSSGFDKESGIKIKSFQILVKDNAYVDALDLADEVHELFKNKPGFPHTIEDVFFCEVIGSPYPVDRDARGRYIFASNYIIRQRGEAESS